jgi:hypothetical protein
MLDGSEHQITNVLAADAARGGEEAHGLAITAIEREGEAFTIKRNGIRSRISRTTSMFPSSWRLTE